jgi:dTDP-4-dehydrorhamnose 3,5-epimerase
MPVSTQTASSLRVTSTAIPEILLVEPAVFRDERGYFFESYNQSTMERAGISASFVQDNQSHSVRGVLRGLHYQLPPHAQGKLVRVLSGEIFDVAVDIRHSSATFGKWVGVNLSAQEPGMLWIPAGFAHGFLVLSESADVLYKTTDFYSPACERTLRWDDPAIGIHWPLASEPTLSKKDELGIVLTDAEVFA